MAFKKVETGNPRFDGFFLYENGNQIEGEVQHTVITGQDNNGKDKGFVAIKIVKPCWASEKDKDTKQERKWTAEAGSLIAVSLTSATRVLIGTEGKMVRCTFNKFTQTQKGRYQDWTVEIDDGQG